jgi:hypothetical protein
LGVRSDHTSTPPEKADFPVEKSILLLNSEFSPIETEPDLNLDKNVSYRSGFFNG